MARSRRPVAPPVRNPAFKRARKFDRASTGRPWLGRLVRVGLLLGSAVIMVNALFGARGLVSTLRAKQEYAALEGRISRMRAENAALRRQVQRLRNDPEAIEILARERLGLIYPGEMLFVVTPPEAHTEQRRRDTQRLQDPHRDDSWAARPTD